MTSSVQLKLTSFQELNNYDEEFYKVRLFGINSQGTSISVLINGFKPRFFIKVPEKWNKSILRRFLNRIRGNDEDNLIKVSANFWKRKKLNGFDGQKLHKFVCLKFDNTNDMNKCKNLWYKLYPISPQCKPGKFDKKKPIELEIGNFVYLLKSKTIKEKVEIINFNEENLTYSLKNRNNFIYSNIKENQIECPSVYHTRKLKINKIKSIDGSFKEICGFNYDGDILPLYEANIPTLLRLFHTQKISPSGWVQILPDKKINGDAKQTTCKFEYEANFENIHPLTNKDESVPYKICAYDIEANSSHGDLPQPRKDYKKLAQQILEEIENLNKIYNCIDDTQKNDFIKDCICYALGNQDSFNIDKIYTIDDVPKDKDGIPTGFYSLIKKKLNQFKLSESEIEEIKYEDDDNSNYFDSSSVNFNTNQIDCPITKYEFKKKNSEINDRSISIIDLLWHPKYSKDTKINELTKILNSSFPKIKGDEVTFIGCDFIKHDDASYNKRYCIVLGECNEVDGAEIISCKNEKEVLLTWTRIIQKEDPDILTGYNIFGFDVPFLHYRAKANNCLDEFLQITKIKKGNGKKAGIWKKNQYGGGSYDMEKKSIILASGEYDLNIWPIVGRLQIDLLNLFRRDYNMDSYSLDNVSSYFIGGKVKEIKRNSNALMSTIIKTPNLQGLEIGNYIMLQEIGHSINTYKGPMNNHKFKVTSIDYEKSEFIIKGNAKPNLKKSIKWCLCKDDVDHKMIFKLGKGSANDKAIIAKYCIQDCTLLHHLLKKVDVITAYVEMASVCSVPIEFLVMRGQGIKLTSFIAQKCLEKGVLMPTNDKNSSTEGYEGAIVLDPKCGIYNEPVAVNDYSSLYPSSMISEGLSHDSKVWTKEYNLNDEIIKIWPDFGEEGRNDDGSFSYDPETNAELIKQGYQYVDVTYDTYEYRRSSEKAAAKKVKVGYKICRFAQFPNNDPIMCSVLKELLQMRKATRKLIPLQKDEFMKNVLDKRQLAYKLTGNSLYGGTGAKSSTFCDIDVAASCTATGRKLLLYSKEIIENVYGNMIYETKSGDKLQVNAEYVYGDTDSVFYKFNFKDYKTKEKLSFEKNLEYTIELATEVGRVCTMWLKPPHNFEYEKTFAPFILVSKKRYVGVLYENDIHESKRKSMGLVLKRRDNAPIVKDIYGGIIDILMSNGEIQKAVEFLKNQIQNLMEGNVAMDKLTITKSLRSGYKNPQQIAHKVLADRMGERDPGSKPRPGERMKYIYIKTQEKCLQGEKIEPPEYIKLNNIPIDYELYVTNQILKPVLQLFALEGVLELMPGYDLRQNNKNIDHKYKDFPTNISGIREIYETQAAELEESNMEPEKYNKKLQDLRSKYAKDIILEDF